MRTYKANGKTYAELEESILSCLIIDAKLMKKLKVEEKHFQHFGYLFVFLKEFYDKYKCLDINLIFSKVKGMTEMKLMDALTYIADIEITSSNFDTYQNELIDRYKKGKVDEWLRKKIYEKATQLLVGKIDIAKYLTEVERLVEYSHTADWK